MLQLCSIGKVSEEVRYASLVASSLPSAVRCAGSCLPLVYSTGGRSPGDTVRCSHWRQEERLAHRFHHSVIKKSASRAGESNLQSLLHG